MEYFCVRFSDLAGSVCEISCGKAVRQTDRQTDRHMDVNEAVQKNHKLLFRMWYHKFAEPFSAKHSES